MWTYGYVKQLKYAPLNPKGPYSISTLQEMHNKEVTTWIDYDQAFDVAREGMLLH